MSEFPLLKTINDPNDLKKIAKDALPQLADELRQFILTNVSNTGGHLASNLGSIELTIALHYIFNTPDDLLVWDVGHQAYAHKILTNRRDQITTLRQFGGLAGFPKREESIYDTFGVGHSSTSISAALGMAVANSKLQKTNKVVAIIGDGAMTAGLAFEGLNNAGWLDLNILVILNDNEMSISENVGAISRYLSKILKSRFYHSMKNTANKALKHMPNIKQIASKVEEHVKGLIMPSTLFEEFGFNYSGPINGHDLDGLLDTLTEINKLSGPQFLHIVTKKGNGYKLAENNPITYHGVSKFNTEHGIISSSPLNLANSSASLSNTPTASTAASTISTASTASPSTVAPALPKLTYTEIFGMWLCDIAKLDTNFIAITPAMREGSGMVEFARSYPKQFFDVGIAEQHAVTFAAGAATQGIKPIVAIYSTFLQRAYDQLIHDVAIQNLPVMFAIDRAGIVGADGPTHTGAFDLSYLLCIPNMVVLTPSDENECYHMLNFAYHLQQPCAVRYPRGTGSGAVITKNQPLNIKYAKGEVIRQGATIAILAFGTLLAVATNIANQLNATLCNMRFAKPLDIQLITTICQNHKYIVTIEENVVIGGVGSLCATIINALNLNNQILNIGLDDEFVPHGDPKAIYKYAKLDEAGILTQITSRFNL